MAPPRSSTKRTAPKWKKGRSVEGKGDFIGQGMEDAGGSPDGGASDEEVKLNGKKQKKEPHVRSKAKRSLEEDEIEAIEARLRAEVPPPGSGNLGAVASAVGSGKGVGKAATAGGKTASAATSAGDGPALTTRLFTQLPVSKRTLRGLASGKFVKMTAIQSAAIPHALGGRDVLGEARTGSGKTLAFLVPVVELLFRRKWSKLDGLGALVVSPTRELAYQIYRVLTTIGGDHEFSAGCCVGGRDLKEEQGYAVGMSILVATPGRLLQHLDESVGFDASNLQILVLDEADRILDLGFQETVKHILQHLPTERQTLLFSATLHTSVHRLGKAALRQPEMISVHKDATSRTPDKLKQLYMVVNLENKVDVLFSFLRSHSYKKLIIFVSACKQVRFLYEAFRKLKPGPAVMELHGRQSLTKRMLVFQEFTERASTAALFCTDIAARGVDFPAVDWVVQLDCPDSVESYIHRVGRTARYDASGSSALFLLPSEESFVEKLKAARIAIRGINAKQNKVWSIRGKLTSLLAEDGAIKHLARKAFTSYVRSIHLMRDKEVFSVKALPRDEFAGSLGLSNTPEVESLPDGEDVEKNSNKKRKNQTALQRLKEKIKSRKVDAQAAASDGDKEAAAAAARAEEDEEEREELEGGGKKKVGKWERRQRRLKAAAAAAKAQPTKPPDENRIEEDELLVPVGEQASIAAEAAAAKAASSSAKKKMKLGRDGVARGVGGQHTFFSGKAGEKASAGGLAQVAEDLSAAAGPAAPAAVGETIGTEGRSAFLDRVARDLASRDSSDAAVSRARIHERHQQLRRKARDARKGGGDSGDEGGPVAVLGGASSGEEDDNRQEASASDSPSRSPSPRPGPTKKSGRKQLGKNQGHSPVEGRGVSAAEAAPLFAKKFGKARVEPSPMVASTGGNNGGAMDDLGALEREALGRLGGGGLFM